ncbi:hypothetical protein [Embleya sp. NBC_00896]|uniref:hypothetical protein n=1 Tax=Embleya sp. NBC_00896 TaxID=2975961 RepID=UPI003867A353|nr:hypothetical protein OG928_26060 [Embleya sp. NBC_00896]
MRPDRVWAPPPIWVPPTGHSLRKVGVFFDAVRVPLPLGEDIAARLIAAAKGDQGPIIRDRNRWMYFLIAPGSAEAHTWPAGVTCLTSRTGRTQDAYIGIPGLYGETWPLHWRRPPVGERLVDGARLAGILRTSPT